MATYMIEGEWTGPSSPAGGYTRHVHREYTKSKRRADDCERLGSILYTDGTRLLLSVEDVTETHYTKRRPKINGYSKLIGDCLAHGVSAVADLPGDK